MKLENKIHAIKLIKFGTPLYFCPILFVHLTELMDILPIELQICEIMNSIRNSNPFFEKLTKYMN